LADWENIRIHNIEGAYTAFDECVRAGVKRLIFASTNHTQHGNTMGSAPGILDMSKHTIMKLTDPPNPDSLYGASKVFGELLGKYFSQKYGLSFVGLRIGWLIPEDDPSVMKGTEREDYMCAMWLSHRDCVEAHRCALEVNTDFMIAYAVSNNDRRVFDLESTKETLGFVPKDNSEAYFQD
jgi:nucleoside-diphosphate-sugar epimerase